jgi:hypothetical protein
VVHLAVHDTLEAWERDHGAAQRASGHGADRGRMELAFASLSLPESRATEVHAEGALLVRVVQLVFDLSRLDWIPARIARFAATVWIVCDCGASMARRVDEDDTLARNG